jgi:hypothetical protein
MFARFAMSSNDVFAKPKLRKHQRADCRIFDRRAAASACVMLAGIATIVTRDVLIVNMYRTWGL